MEELWKDCLHYEGRYQVSNLGRVKSLLRNEEHILTPRQQNNGYLVLTLMDKNHEPKQELVHRLVALTFLEIPEGCTQVNHKNEDKTDNRVENLEWCSPAYNMNYGSRSERAAANYPENKDGRRVNQYTLDGEFVATYRSINMAAKIIDGNEPGILYAITKSKTHIYKNYIWAFI